MTEHHIPSFGQFLGFAQDLKVGNKKIDREHAQLVESMTRLSRSLAAGATGKSVAAELLAIVGQAREHFQTEERLFNQYNYPDAATHCEEHAKFLSEMPSIAQAVDQEQEVARRASLVDKFLVDWLRAHVITHDREFARFLHEREGTGGGLVDKFLWHLFQCHLEDVLGDALKHIHGLFMPWYHTDLIISRRSALIVSRVRMLAGLFALLTPTWIVIDFIFLPNEVAFKLAAARLLASLCFGGLSLMLRRSDNIIIAYLGIGLLFLIPTLFFVYTNTLFSVSLMFTPMAASLVTGYAFLPFVMAAGISIFPLTAFEGVTLALPGLVAEYLTGNFHLNFHTGPNNYGTLWLLILIAGVATLAGMSQLHFWIEIVSKSSHDQLTRVYNRLTGQELMEKYIHMACRHHTPLCLFFFDLDNFKSVNDVYGHEAGDETLQIFASSLVKATRKEDIVVRWGGEEFLVLAPLASQEDASLVMERICRKGNLGLRPDGKPITASVGMAEVVQDRLESLPQLIALADNRMYRAKKAGKNRVCFGEQPQSMTPVGTF